MKSGTRWLLRSALAAVLLTSTIAYQLRPAHTCSELYQIDRIYKTCQVSPQCVITESEFERYVNLAKEWKKGQCSDPDESPPVHQQSPSVKKDEQTL